MERQSEDITKKMTLQKNSTNELYHWFNVSMWWLVVLLVLTATLGVGSSDTQDVVKPLTGKEGTASQGTAKDNLSSISTSRLYPKITSVTPHYLQRSTARKIDLVIENLPQILENITCAFSFVDETFITEAERKANGMSCKTPRTDNIPSIPTGKHNITAQLSVRPTNGSDFVSTSFVFFDCNSFSSCTQCVSSDYPCDWCLDGNRCTHDTAENCRNDILVTGISRVGPSYRSGPQFCPAIVGTSSGLQEILVADNSKKTVRVRVHIVGQFIVQNRFVCAFKIEGKQSRVNAQLLVNTIYCDAMEFSYTSTLSNINASFAILWDGGHKALDNPDNIYVNIYRCRDLANTCGRCLTLDDKYGCGWCQGSSSCEILEQCSKSEDGAVVPSNHQDVATNPPTWISSKIELCPTITSITPKHLQRTTVRSVDLVIENSPQNSGNISCAFSFADKNKTVIVTEAIKNEKEKHVLSCKTPPTDGIPLIPAGEHNISAQLSVRSTNGSDFVSTYFLFFDCNTFSSCTQCVSSDYPCDWCVTAHRCTHDSTENCHNDVLVSGFSQVGPSYRRGPKFCPAIVGTSSGLQEILVAENSKRAVRVKVHIIGQFIVQNRFVCEFNIAGNKSRVNAVLLADTIYCTAMEFSYTSTLSNINASFAILWDGGHKALDNPDNIYLNIYRCRNLADTCGRCLTLDSKYDCSWCQSSRSCEISEHCNKSEKSTNLYSERQDAAIGNFSRTSLIENCPTINSITPKHLQRTTLRSVELVIENLPQFPGNLSCAFSFADASGFDDDSDEGSFETFISEAEKKKNGVSCKTPPTNNIPSIAAGEHNITAQLSVRRTNGSDFISTSFVFFDCNTFSSCTQCVSSDYPCDWCLDVNRCTHNTTENCRNDILVTGISRVGPSYRCGPQFCPAIVGTSSGSQEILVADNSKKTVRVRVHIVGQFIVQNRFVCEFNIEGNKSRVNAQLLADTMYCDAMKFSYTSTLPKINASVAILWDGGHKALDNPANIYVNIYRCRELADTCGSCLILDVKYGCGWCQSSSSCEILEDCDKGHGIWVEKNLTCP